MKISINLLAFLFLLEINLLAQQSDSTQQKSTPTTAYTTWTIGVAIKDTSAPAIQNKIVKVWGRDLTTRLDTLPPTLLDTFSVNHHTFKIVVDANYAGSFYPHIVNGILVYCDAAGNVQNIAVKEFYFDYNIGTMVKTGYSPNRELYNAASTIQFHKVGDFITVKNIYCVDTSGKKMNLVLPPFKIVKVR